VLGVTTLREAAAAARGRLSSGDGRWAGISTDTRSLQPGQLFVALRGEHFDGHEFVSAAFARGAAGAVVSAVRDEWSRDPACAGKPLIVVDDTLAALGALAAAHRSRFEIPVVAVTGSTGKTTVKEMIAHVLGKSRRVLQSAENFNNEIGVPLTLLSLNADHQAAVIEMAMRGRGQIRYLAGLARPSMGVITNIGPSHLELLGDLESVARAKGELLESLNGGVAVLNADDEQFSLLASLAPGPVVTFGIECPADFGAADLRPQPAAGFRFRFTHPAGALETTLPLPGQHQVYNALATAAAVAQLGVDGPAALAALGDFQARRGRLRMVRSSRGFTIIDDCYNASPASMRAALEVLAEFEGGRRYAVLGDMKELGSGEVAFHREVGAAAAAAGLETLVTFGELARHLGEAAADRLGGDRVIAADDHEAAADLLLERLAPGDTVLVKGSRAMGMERIVERLAHG
jgi:UDP-N-acetylmuramoyl-tripeptide--D-alanyl-D-alanine ligase